MSHVPPGAIENSLMFCMEHFLCRASGSLPDSCLPFIHLDVELVAE